MTLREEHDMPDPWRLLKRFPGMSTIGRKIMGAKLDRMLAARLRDSMPHPGRWQAEVDKFTADINRLACTAAKNW